MELAGEWLECSDGVTRPTITVDIATDAGVIRAVRFIIDTGADRTVLAAPLLGHLPPPSPPPQDLALSGIGGTVPFGMVSCALEFPRERMQPVMVHGEFAVLTDLSVLDMSVLGRDVMDHFDVIVSRRRDTVVLLAGNHHFAVQGP